MDDFSFQIATLLVGVVILTLGRRLFWFFVGGLGFISGIHIARQIFVGQPDGIVLLIAVFSGGLGAVVALFLQRAAVILSGFFAGGLICSNLAHPWAMQLGEFFWLLFPIGGVIGAVLAAVFFDWALIGLSALTGATLTTGIFSLGPWATFILTGVLFTTGFLIQAGHMKKTGPFNRPGIDPKG